MPNWCSNTLTITGDKQELKRIIDAVSTEKDGSTYYTILQSLYPCPDDLKNTVSGFSSDPEQQAEYKKAYDANLAKYGFKNWYDWCCTKWGTKWSDNDTELTSQDDTSIVFSFQTAWSPPTAGIEHISTLFSTVTFELEFYELGCGFAGAFIARAGETSEHVSDITFPEDTDGDDLDWSALDDECADLMNEALVCCREDLEFA